MANNINKTEENIMSKITVKGDLNQVGATFIIESISDAVTVLTQFNDEQPGCAAIADGHNPSGLTEFQVGTADGWRLLTFDEIERGAADKSLVKYWDLIDFNWQNPNADGTDFTASSTYRTVMKAGYFTDRCVTFRREVVVDLEALNHAISFGHPQDLIESIIRKYENL